MTSPSAHYYPGKAKPAASIIAGEVDRAGRRVEAQEGSAAIGAPGALSGPRSAMSTLRALLLGV